MLPDEAAARFLFDDQLFSLNDAGLWNGRANGQVWIGETPDQGAAPLGYKDDRHVCLVSGTRGGKGTGTIIPNLCLWPGSCIVVDPKGENATITANRRGPGSAWCYGMGQSVRILDPYDEVQLDASLKARFNPLDAIDPASDFAIDDAGRIAGALIIVQNQNEPFWEEAARDVVKALILHVLTDPDFEGERNLVSVWRLVNQGDYHSVAALREAGEKEIPSGFDLLWQALKNNRAFNGMVSGAGDYLASMAERTRSSVLGAAKTNLEFISGPPMQRLLQTSDFDLATLKTDPKGLSLYLTLPQRYMATHYRWLRLMITMAVGEMERVKGRPATGFPTLFVLDEFAGMKRLEVIEHAVAQAAGFGVKFLFIVQSLVQLKDTYKDSWEVFLGNAGLQLFFQIADDFTRSYLSRQVGEQEVRRQSVSGSESSSESDSQSDGWSATLGRNTGTSTSVTRGQSSGKSFNYTGPLRIFSTSHSNQRGENLSTSHSHSSGSSESWSKSGSSSLSRSNSVTDGWTDAIHKRPLLNPDEIGRFLARVDDPDDPGYPGLLLALIPGEQPLLARRINYFESDRFGGYFDPHPDYPAPPTLAERARLAELARRRAAAAAKAPAAQVAPAQAALQIPAKRRDGRSWLDVVCNVAVGAVICAAAVFGMRDSLKRWYEASGDLSKPSGLVSNLPACRSPLNTPGRLPCSVVVTVGDLLFLTDTNSSSCAHILPGTVLEFFSINKVAWVSGYIHGDDFWVSTDILGETRRHGYVLSGTADRAAGLVDPYHFAFVPPPGTDRCKADARTP